MKCNSCGYENGWVPEKLDVVEGEHGEFYRSSTSVMRALTSVTLQPVHGVLSGLTNTTLFVLV